MIRPLSSQMPFLLLLLAATSSLLTPSLAVTDSAHRASAGGAGVTYHYAIDVGPDCVADVRVLVMGGEAERSTWIALPRLATGFTTNASAIEQVGAIQGRGSPLYLNVTFRISRGTTVEFRYAFPHACLVLGRRAAFLSPLIALPPGASGSISVRVMWPGSSQVRVETASATVTRTNDGFVVTGTLPTLSGRLSFSFSVPEERPVEFGNGSLTFLLPERYRSVAERLLALHDRVRENLTGLFARKPERVRVALFLPERYDEGPEGYVTVPDEGSVGGISLNLYLLRMVEGMLDVTFLHELIHQYLFANGVGAGATWLHEGLSTYLSVRLVMGTGQEAASYIQELLDRENVTVQELRGLLAWMAGEERGRRWYAMAYRAVELLFSADRDGMTRAISSLGNATVRTSADAAEHVFDHLNAEGRRVMLESGLVSAHVLVQEIGSEPRTPDNATSGSDAMNETVRTVQGPARSVVQEYLVLAIAAVLTTSVIALVLIDARRT